MKNNIGSIRKNASGSWTGEINHAYRRYRYTHMDKINVQKWLQRVHTGLIHGQLPLTPGQEADAKAALLVLPEGVTLLDAATAYPKRQGGSLAAVVAEFLADKQGSGLRGQTMSQYRGVLQRLAESVEGDPKSINTSVLIGFCDAQGLIGITRDNNRRVFSVFFEWCIKRGYVVGNPATGMSNHRADDKLPEILTVAQTAGLLAAAQELHPELCPYLALGLFAGIRPAELERLTWDAVGWTEGVITVAAAASKTRNQRHVTMSDGLRAWLTVAGVTEGPVVPVGRKCLYSRLAKVRAKAGITHWPADVMRHSFATYHLALHRNAPGTALEMGHAGVQMLFTNYRGLATGEAAAEYFGLRPEGVTEI